MLIDERDAYLATRLREAPGDRVVAVVGAGHVAGMLDALAQRPPDGSRGARDRAAAVVRGALAGWCIPVVIVAGLMAIGLRHGPAAVGDNALFWILATGLPALVGSALALAHPLTMLATFLSAPITTLSPLLGVGYVAALVQAYVRPPLVREIQTVAEDVRVPRRWWQNRLLRICLVFLLSTIFTSMGTLVGTTEILRQSVPLTMRGGGWAWAAVAAALLVGLAGSGAALGDRRSGAGPGDPAARRRRSQRAERHHLGGRRSLGGGVRRRDGRLYWLRIAINPADGRITSASVEGAVPLPRAPIWKASRSCPAESRWSSPTRSDRSSASTVCRTANCCAPRRSRRCSRRSATTSASKSLTRDASGQFWTANEEALKADGPTSTAAKGTIVRLLRLDRDLRPTGQWAYLTDPVAGAQILSDRGTGLSDLAALPDGRFIALERSFGTEGLRIRLYEVDLAGATEVSKLPRLAGADVVVARKHLLWQYASLNDNFEGIGLGPELEDGSRSVVLVSDDGHALLQQLYRPAPASGRDAGARSVTGQEAASVCYRRRKEERHARQRSARAAARARRVERGDRQDPQATQMGGRVLNIFATLAHHPKLLKRWLVFGNHVLAKSTLSRARARAADSAHRLELPRRVRVGTARRDRQAGRSQRRGDRAHHARARTRRAGIPSRRCCCAPPTSSTATAASATRPGRRSARSYDTQQLIDVVFTVGQYTLVSMALNSLGVQLDEGIPASRR